MNSGERKAQFTRLLQELLTECGGVQARLAEKLQISSKRISSWFQRQVDPTNLETGIFERIAKVKGCSAEELARMLGLIEINKTAPNKFQGLITEILSSKTQEQLGARLGVSQIAISNWLNPEKHIDPAKISAGTMFAIAQEKGWTFDDLLSYLELKEEKTPKKLLIKYKSELSVLSLKDQIELLAWLSVFIDERTKKEDRILRTTSQSEKKALLILEKDDVAIASEYLHNLGIYTQLQFKNISLATPRSLPQSLSIFDVLLFNFNNQQSPCIPLIDSLQFDGDVVAIVDRSLPNDIQDRLKDKVTEVIVKPVPWSELKQKDYFS